MTRNLPAWRSLLYVPTTSDRFIEKSAATGADAIILDLEDAVAPAEKPRARARLAMAVPRAARGGAEIVVRINRPWRSLVADLEAAVIAGVRALMLPKIDNAEQVRVVSEMTGEWESERGLAPGAIGLIPMVETARGFFHADAIAASDARVIGLTLGSEDFSLSMGAVPGPEALFYPKQQIVIAARAAGVLPIGLLSSVADFTDLDAFRAVLQRSRQLGFVAAPAIHPVQIPLINEAYTPSQAEVAAAERLIAANEEALAAGRGAFALDGKMVDVPVVERARNTLARAAAIARRSGA